MGYDLMRPILLTHAVTINYLFAINGKSMNYKFIGLIFSHHSG